MIDRITLSQRSIDFIIEQEVTSQEYYDKRLTKLTWPGGASGVTGGIGYDFGQTSEKRITDDWQFELNANNISYLVKTSGVIGEHAQRMLLKSPELQRIRIPFHSAKRVFMCSSLRVASRSALAIYPELYKLAPDAAGAIVSMVYNRGNRLKDINQETKDRLEMRNIAPLVASKDYSGIAYQVMCSKRLWLDKGLNGLVSRREAESKLIHNADKEYNPYELVEIVL